MKNIYAVRLGRKHLFRSWICQKCLDSLIFTCGCISLPDCMVSVAICEENILGVESFACTFLCSLAGKLFWQQIVKICINLHTACTIMLIRASSSQARWAYLIWGNGPRKAWPIVFNSGSKAVKNHNWATSSWTSLGLASLALPSAILCMGLQPFPFLISKGNGNGSERCSSALREPYEIRHGHDPAEVRYFKI